MLGYLNYPDPYVAFGNDLFNSTAYRFAVNNLDGTYQLLMNGWSLQFNGEDITALKPIELNEPGNGIPEKDAAFELERFLKAYIQQYNYRLIHNKLVVTHGDE